MSAGRGVLAALIARFAGGLRFPTLFLVLGAVFLLDLLVPDSIPFVDEILLGLGTLLLASLRSPDEPEEDDAES
ncbi:MAG: hypothetical protein CL910_17565 [Deltaproteobacteria bacterium]|jgi:hypothetical protein|nr:hypothetical protein [Deltaproteobacteria bacterium]